jgi:hypothetical protein
MRFQDISAGAAGLLGDLEIGTRPHLTQEETSRSRHGGTRR